ncbi:uncharacterized protein LOC112638650 [Camponotus floridanus]|uniref:uncharacterized protein LOC112638650 n=1 Tax=Camponotus floridanus TaxID=104421 RepID=UPI000DC6992A|nr:uncharacterized protein LOC112638650 [Camponotus floridanus]
MHSMSYHYLAEVSTISHIIGETCYAIWNSIRQEVIPPSKTTEEWLHLAKEFEERWNFNHCIGAIDGKHVIIECPPNARSSYYNYKNSHSIVLLGICDAQYIFTFVNIGAYGRRNDGGIFRNSKMGLKFHSNEINVLVLEPLSPGGSSLPYVLVGDEAFQLTNYLLQPYPGKGGSWRSCMDNSAFMDITQCGSNNSSRRAMQI